MFFIAFELLAVLLNCTLEQQHKIEKFLQFFIELLNHALTLTHTHNLNGGEDDDTRFDEADLKAQTMRMLKMMSEQNTLLYIIA